jgi:hypothetical protein
MTPESPKPDDGPYRQESIEALRRAAQALLLALRQAHLIPHDFSVDRSVENLRDAIDRTISGRR